MHKYPAWIEFGTNMQPEWKFAQTYRLNNNYADRMDIYTNNQISNYVFGDFDFFEIFEIYLIPKFRRFRKNFLQKLKEYLAMIFVNICDYKIPFDLHYL